MSLINLEKVDKFFLIFALVMILMATLVVLTFRGVFSSYIDAFNIDQKEITAGLNINKVSLEEAHTWAFNKHTVALEIRD